MRADILNISKIRSFTIQKQYYMFFVLSYYTINRGFCIEFLALATHTPPEYRLILAF
jgi:hypothetical protein